MVVDPAVGDGDTGDDPPGALPLEPELDAVFGFRDDGWQKRAARAVQPASPMGSLAGYSLIQELGRGGQGSVYKAIQPGTGRIVAIKRLGSAVLLGERQSERFHERYRAEIEAVTRLQHPCIVTVHTAEVLDGHPVLVMEFVEGETIDRWAQEQWLHARDPVSAVLACFLRVCEGVSHAHTRGVIHRDLKPSNILVTGVGDGSVADAAVAVVPSVKVLDFGIARLLDGWREAERTVSGFAGTPVYASPEQLTSPRHSLDTRSDVYSLGVLLFTLLSGREPCRPGASISEVIDSMQCSEAHRPSRARPGIARELDLIVLKATEFEAADRYQSVDAFREDVQRFLEGRPIAAHPPGRRYLLGKFVGRHRVACAVGAAAALAIVSLAAISSVQALRLGTRSRDLAAALHAQQSASRIIEAARARAESQRRLALEEGERQRRTSDFLLGLVENIATSSEGRTTIAIGQLAQWIDGPLGKVSAAVDPVALARLRLGVGTMYNSANRNDRASAHVRAAIGLLPGPANAELRVRALIQLSSLQRYRGPSSPALAKARDAMAAVDQTGLSGTVLHVQALRQLSVSLVRDGQRDQSFEPLWQALAIAEKSGQPVETRAGVLADLAGRFYGAHKYDEAGKWADAAVASVPAEAQGTSEAFGRAMVCLGMIAFASGAIEESERCFTRVCADQVKHLGDGHIRARNAMRWRARALHELGRYDDAARICERLLQLVPPEYETVDLGTWQLHFRYGATLLGQGRIEEGNRQLRLAITRGGTQTSDVEPELQRVKAALTANQLHLCPALRQQLGDLAWLVDYTRARDDSDNVSNTETSLN